MKISEALPRVLVNACGAKSGGARQMLAMLVQHAPGGRYVVACPDPAEFAAAFPDVTFVDVNTGGTGSAIFTLFKAEKLAHRMGCSILLSMMNFNSVWGSCQRITYFHQMLCLTQNDPKSLFQRLMLHVGTWRGDLTICQTQFVAQLLSKKGINGAASYWPGFPMELQDPMPHVHAASSKDKTVFFVPLSNHAAYKNLASVIAARAFFEELGADVYITGGADIGIDGPFHFLGKVPRPELFERTRSADAILFPSLEETCALPVAEALSLGTPAFVLRRPYNADNFGGLSAGQGYHVYEEDFRPAILEWISKGKPKCAPQLQLSHGDWSWLP